MAYLSIRDLSVAYKSRHGRVLAADHISLDVEKGGSLGLVGESGCGKSTLATALLGLLPKEAEVTAEALDLNGESLLGTSAERLRERRWNEVAYVPQGAAVALSPVTTLHRQFAETWMAHRKEGRDVLLAKARELFQEVDLDPDWLKSFPHQLSGGMRQRAIIALALLLQPELLVADEPTTGLDVIVQRQVLDVLKRLQRDHDTTLVFVSHDIAVVAELCRSLAVMYAGRIVELGEARALLQAPKHPYTMALRRSFPDIRTPERPLLSIPGRPPALGASATSCVFADRCPFAEQKCRETVPPLREVGGVKVACHFAESAGEMVEAFRSEAVWAEVKEA